MGNLISTCFVRFYQRSPNDPQSIVWDTTVYLSEPELMRGEKSIVFPDCFAAQKFLRSRVPALERVTVAA